jgi:hypothetical protein
MTDSTSIVPFGGLHGSGNDKTQFERIVELEHDLAAAQSDLEALRLWQEQAILLCAKRGCSHRDADIAAAKAELVQAQEAAESIAIAVESVKDFQYVPPRIVAAVEAFRGNKNG